MSKLVEYVGVFHSLRESVRERWTQLWSSRGGNGEASNGLEGHEEEETNFRGKVKDKLEKLKQRSIHRINRTSCLENEDYSHLTRPKTRKELLKISAAVMGIEFSYAAETAFVSPLLLNLGVPRRHMTLMWFFSPLLGFFMTPILGSLSDGCRCPMGKRRPFILLLSVGIVLGLILVPNGRLLGLAFGDKDDFNQGPSVRSAGNLSRGQPEVFVPLPPEEKRLVSRSVKEAGPSSNISVARLKRAVGDPPGQDVEDTDDEGNGLKGHTWGLVFTVLGTVLLDFDADACQSPSRAYMLDVTIPEDHAKGLSTFTVMAGLGGSMGYLLGAFNWEDTFVGTLFGGQVRAVFTLVLFIFIACVVTTIRSFREIPIDRFYSTKTNKEDNEKRRYAKFEEDEEEIELGSQQQQRQNYGALVVDQQGPAESSFIQPNGEIPMHQDGQALGAAPHAETPPPTFIEYVKTIVALPRSLQWLCVTNYFCWMSLVCYSLFFTDFVGQSVFGGVPTAPRGSPERKVYEDGVRFGCLGMSLYSLSCSGYSMIIEGLVCKFGAKQVYIYGQLVYSVGMVLMGLTRHPAGVILLSWTAGIMYATLFTMPYLLVARYHAAETFELNVDDVDQKPKQVRGLGTDVAVVSSMVFLAQMTQAVTLGSIVSIAGSNTAIVFAAAVFAACGSVSARKVLYLDL